MMPGRWFWSIGRQLLHHDTFAMMFEPAVADFQFEVRRNAAARPCDYVAVAYALVAALCVDTWEDLFALAGDADMIALLTIVQTSYYAFMLVLLSGLGTGKLSNMTLDVALAMRVVSYFGAVFAACLVTSCTCFWPSRRTEGALEV